MIRSSGWSIAWERAEGIREILQGAVDDPRTHSEDREEYREMIPILTPSSLTSET